MFFYKQKTAYELRISDWSSDVCSSDLEADADRQRAGDDRDVLQVQPGEGERHHAGGDGADIAAAGADGGLQADVEPCARPEAKVRTGRASGRDRVGRNESTSGVDVSLKKKKTQNKMNNKRQCNT